jgi:hypothetical protein
MHRQEHEMARAHALHTSQVTLGRQGWALTHDLYTLDGQLALGKGTLLDAAALAVWPDIAPGEVHLVELEADELHEDDAGLRVARAVSGAGVRVDGPQQSRYDVVSEHKGLLRVDADQLREVNRVEGVTAYSLLDRQPVLPNKVVASVKITPIAIATARVAEVEQRCAAAARPLLSVLPFRPLRVAVVAVGDIIEEQRTRFESTIERKLRWYGARLTKLRFVAPDVSQVIAALDDCLRAGAELVLTAGGNPIDPLDPVELALPHIGARLLHRGAPTRGSMFWLAQSGAVSIVNLASCRMYAGSSVADLLLPALMTGQPLTSDDIIALGYGGLPGVALADRFPPYDAEPAYAPRA